MFGVILLDFFDILFDQTSRNNMGSKRIRLCLCISLHVIHSIGMNAILWYIIMVIADATSVSI